MKIAFNPQSEAPIQQVPSNCSNDIIFDLSGLSIYAKGVKIKGTDTTYEVFKKETSDNQGGYDGLVPAPSYNNNSKSRFLKEDGTWEIPMASSYRPIEVNSVTIIGQDSLSPLNLEAGNKIALLPEMDVNSNYTGKVTISATYENATQSADGLMSAEDKYKLDNMVFTPGGDFSGTLADAFTTIRVGSASIISSAGKQTLSLVGHSGIDIQLDTTSYTASFGISLSNYSRYNTISNITTSDTLNQALGKLEYKADLGVQAYELVFAANNDDTIENLTEILKVLEGIKDTQTIQGILGNYVTLNTDQEITSVKTFTEQQKFTVAQGTAPFEITSTTVVQNLNANLLQGYLASTLFEEFTNNNRKVSITIGNTNKELTVYYSDNTANIIGGNAGTLVYQSAIDTTAFLTPPTNDGWILSYDKTNKKPIWVPPSVDEAGNSKAITLTSISDNKIYPVVFTDSENCGKNNNAELFIDSIAGSGYNPATDMFVSAGYVKHNSSDSYVLLGGGGHKELSDFMLKSEELTNNVTEIKKNMNVTQNWMDTGITGNNIPENGTYIVQISVAANDSTGSMYNCYWSGVMSWYKDSTNDSETDEILLHRSGYGYANTIYLRTVMRSSSTLKLQIAANKDIGKAYDYTFKFKRIL